MKEDLLTLSKSAELLNQQVQAQLTIGTISWPELRELSGARLYIKKAQAYAFWRGYAVANQLILNKRGLQRSAS
jgi:hypothetical protein